jgi:hypothetical protein
MNSSDKILLSSYLIKAAFQKQAFGAGMMKTIPYLQSLAKPLASRVLASPASKAVGGLDDALTRFAPSVENQLSRGVPAIQQLQQRLAQGLPAKPTQLQPILTNVPNAAPTLPPPSFLTGQAAAPSLASVAPTLPPPSFLTEAAAPALASVAPAAAAAMPTGLGLARQGLGQVMAGTGQALRSGASAVRNRASNAASAVGRGVSTGAAATRRGLVSTAKNPLVQAGAVGLGGGALGTYGMLRAMGVGGAPAAAPSAGSANTGNAQLALYSDPAAKAVDRLVSAPAAASSPAAPAAPAASSPAASSPAAQPDYNQFFKPYMGTNFDPRSRVDQAKLQFLKDLGQGGMDLSNVSGNYGEVYRRMQGKKF